MIRRYEEAEQYLGLSVKDAISLGNINNHIIIVKDRNIRMGGGCDVQINRYRFISDNDVITEFTGQG